MKRRGAKRHAKKSGTKRARRAPTAIVVVENPRKRSMARKHRKHRKHRRHRKSNPAHAAHPVRRRRHRRHRRHNPARVHHKRRHHRRRNPGSALASVMLAIGVGTVGAIAANLAAKEVATLLPSSIPAWGVDAAKVAGGVALGVGLGKKHPAIATGLAVGIAGPSAINLLKNSGLLPASLQGVGFDSGVNDVYAPPVLDAVTLAALGAGNRVGTRIEDLGAVDLGAVAYED